MESYMVSAHKLINEHTIYEEMRMNINIRLSKGMLLVGQEPVGSLRPE